MKTALQGYFDRHPEEKHEKVAARAGISLDTFRNYVRGRRTPRVDSAFAIEDATNGEVPARSWATLSASASD